MQYLGGKVRIAKPICEYINKVIEDNEITTYYEPFCGACNIVIGIKCKNKIASDVHPYLIAMWKELQLGWEPPSVVLETDYQLCKNEPHNWPDYLVSFIGFGCSFSGKFFGGYARNNAGQNYTKCAKNSSLKKSKKLEGVIFHWGSYNDVVPTSLENAVIYCDPPYASTTGYKGTDKFDHVKFWDWVRQMSKKNIVLVSEYQAPDDFECVLEIKTKTDMRTKSGKEPRIEKLFRYKGEIKV